MNAVLQPVEIRTAYDGCPLCSGVGEVLRVDKAYPRGPIQCDLTWMKCGSCAHVHTDSYFNEEGLKGLFSTVMEDGFFGGKLDEQRGQWGGVIKRLMERAADGGKWLDVGVGNGGFLFTAAEFGFNAVGIDTRDYILQPLRELGYQVEHADATEYDYEGCRVVVLADIIEHIPYPKALLKRIRSGLRGALFISCPNMDSMSWRYTDSVGGSPYWKEPEHYHNFTRARLQSLLRECGFSVIDFGVSTRYQAGMEIIAI